MPVVTVVDPRDPGRPADVMSSGDERGPRWSRRTRVLAGILAAAGVLVAVVVPRVLEQRKERAAADAAFAIADEVHLRVAATGIGGGERQLSVGYLLTDDGTQGYADRLVGARLEGDGLRPVEPGSLPQYFGVPFELGVTAAVDCAAVAAGRYPDAVLVTTARPASKVEHVERAPLDPVSVRQAALSACGLPDPDARPVVEVEGSARGQLLLSLTTVQNALGALVVEAVEIAGVAVTTDPGPSLPIVLEPFQGGAVGGIYGFSLRVDDCAAAAEARVVVVRLRVGDVAQTRTADPAVQPQPGSMTVAALLDRLVEQAC